MFVLATVIFHMVVLVCAGCGLLTSIVLLLGIYFVSKILFIFFLQTCRLDSVLQNTILTANNEPRRTTAFPEMKPFNEAKKAEKTYFSTRNSKTRQLRSVG